MLSVNQLNAQIRLLEIWKSVNVSDYPLKCAHYNEGTNVRLTRAQTSGKLIEPGKNNTIKTCISDAIRIWNIAPSELKNSKSIYAAKKQSNCLSKHCQFNIIDILFISFNFIPLQAKRVGR